MAVVKTVETEAVKTRDALPRRAKVDAVQTERVRRPADVTRRPNIPVAPPASISSDRAGRGCGLCGDRHRSALDPLPQRAGDRSCCNNWRCPSRRMRRPRSPTSRIEQHSRLRGRRTRQQQSRIAVPRHQKNTRRPRHRQRCQGSVPSTRQRQRRIASPRRQHRRKPQRRADESRRRLRHCRGAHPSRRSATTGSRQRLDS